MNVFGKEMRAAFHSWWAQLGIVVSAVGIFSTVARMTDLSLSHVVRTVVGAFRDAFHPIIGFLFGWLPFELPIYVKDGLVIWFAIGGAVARTILTILRSKDAHGRMSFHFNYGSEGFNRLMNRSAVARVAFLVALAILWPVSLILFMIKPIVGQGVATGSNVYVSAGRVKSIYLDDPRQRGRYICDLRAVFLIQLLTILVSIGALAVANMVSF